MRGFRESAATWRPKSKCKPNLKSKSKPKSKPNLKPKSKPKSKLDFSRLPPT